MRDLIGCLGNAPREIIAQHQTHTNVLYHRLMEGSVAGVAKYRDPCSILKLHWTSQIGVNDLKEK